MFDTTFHQYAIKHDESHKDPVSNHYPLSKQEIAELLQLAGEAWQRNDLRTTTSIQYRLLQGIVGYQCPLLIEGPVSKADYLLSELFVSRKGHYTDFELVDKLYAIMHHQGI